MEASKAITTLIILLNIVFFACVSVSSTKVSCPPTTGSTPSSTPSTPKKQAKCPKDTLKFGVCGDWLGLVHEAIGAQPSSKCCTLLTGLADLEAAFCLCTAIKANVLGILNVEVPIALTLLVNSCGKKIPEGFKCA